jgi:hypothetical protein
LQGSRDKVAPELCRLRSGAFWKRPTLFQEVRLCCDDPELFRRASTVAWLAMNAECLCISTSRYEFSISCTAFQHDNSRAIRSVTAIWHFLFMLGLLRVVAIRARSCHKICTASELISLQDSRIAPPRAVTAKFIPCANHRVLTLRSLASALSEDETIDWQLDDMQEECWYRELENDPYSVFVN